MSIEGVALQLLPFHWAVVGIMLASLSTLVNSCKWSSETPVGARHPSDQRNTRMRCVMGARQCGHVATLAAQPLQNMWPHPSTVSVGEPKQTVHSSAWLFTAAFLAAWSLLGAAAPAGAVGGGRYPGAAIAAVATGPGLAIVATTMPLGSNATLPSSMPSARLRPPTLGSNTSSSVSSPRLPVSSQHWQQRQQHEAQARRSRRLQHTSTHIEVNTSSPPRLPPATAATLTSQTSPIHSR